MKQRSAWLFLLILACVPTAADPPRAPGKLGQHVDVLPPGSVSPIRTDKICTRREIHGGESPGEPIQPADGSFVCARDWDGNGTRGDARDVIACIETALGEITDADGFDNAVTVKLPSGYFDVSEACADGGCFELKSGIRIVGEMPRLRHVSGKAPDLHMIPDGGTWLDPGPTHTLFVGRHLRGVVLERFGVANFGSIARFGGDGEEGIAFSVIRDVYGVGTSRWDDPRSATAWELYNIQHVRMDHVKVHNVERGLYIIGQDADWQPANSVISDLYVYTYPDPEGAIRLEVRRPSVGEPLMMNYVTFIRPQVNAFLSSAPGSSGILLKGYDEASPVQMVSILSADVEGPLGTGIRLEEADHNHIEIAAIPGAPTGVSMDAGSQFNTVISSHDRVVVSDIDGTYNFFHGHYDSVDEGRIQGLAWDRQERRWSLSLGGEGLLSAGDGYLWHDDTSRHWRIAQDAPQGQSDGAALVTGTGAGARQGPALWADEPRTCDAACSAAGMVECVAAWAGAASVSCDAGAGRRICACR